MDKRIVMEKTTSKPCAEKNVKDAKAFGANTTKPSASITVVIEYAREVGAYMRESKAVHDAAVRSKLVF